MIAALFIIALIGFVCGCVWLINEGRKTKIHLDDDHPEWDKVKAGILKGHWHDEGGQE
jgi:hypothetical protein